MSSDATLADPGSDSVRTVTPSLREIALVFLKLGTIAFGGPAVHLAMMEEEFVRRKKWLTSAEFLDRMGTANLIPGPSSTEVAIFVGQLKRGWRGLIVAGSCFIVPAAVIVTFLAWVYVRYGSLPEASRVLYAIKPVVVAIVVQALWKFGKTGLRTWSSALIAVAAAVATFLGMSPVLILVASGAAAAAWNFRSRQLAAFIALPKIIALTGLVVAVEGPDLTRLRTLFLSFLKLGAVVFGSGYVLLAFLHSEFIGHLHWLTEKQLIDAVAVGQFTPGPLFTTATFIGYIVAGFPGAVIATVAIFLPGFLLVAASGPLIPRIRRSPVISSALDGVIAASIALMAVVAVQLGQAAITDRLTLGLFAVSVLAIFRFAFNPAWLIAAAALGAALVQSW